MTLEVALPLTRCWRCGQCSDLAAKVPPLDEWLCWGCSQYMLATMEGRES